MKSIRLGLCVTMGVATGIALACYPGGTDAAERAFEMKAYVDYRGGRQVVAGDSAAAMQAASRNADKSGEAGMIANTNLCVAFTKTGQFIEAEAVCTKAVTLAEKSGPGRIAPVLLAAGRRQGFRRTRARHLSLCGHRISAGHRSASPIE